MTFDEYRELLRKLKRAGKIRVESDMGFLGELPERLSKKYLDMIYEDVLEEFKQLRETGMDGFNDLPNKRG